MSDAHLFDERHRAQIGDLIERCGRGEAREDAKLVLVGVGDVATGIVGGREPLRELVDVVQVGRQSDATVSRIVALAERAANLEFKWREDLVSTAAGSVWAIQRLCFLAARDEGLATTLPYLTRIGAHPSETERLLMEELSGTYHEALHQTMSTAVDASANHRIGWLALLSLLAKSTDGTVSIAEARRRYESFAPAFDAVTEELAGRRSQAGALRHSLQYEPDGQVLSLTDMRFAFYLRRLAWIELARSSDLIVGVAPDGTLSFPVGRR